MVWMVDEWIRSIGGLIWRKQSTGGSTCPSATLSIRNSVFDDLGSSPVFSGEKPATKA